MAKHPVMQMAKGEQDHHKIKGLCYNYHKPRYFSKNYPDSNTVVASSSNKPSGPENFGTWIDFEDVEKQ